jgi:hypothetical protein
MWIILAVGERLDDVRVVLGHEDGDDAIGATANGAIFDVFLLFASTTVGIGVDLFAAMGTHVKRHRSTLRPRRKAKPLGDDDPFEEIERALDEQGEERRR